MSQMFYAQWKKTTHKVIYCILAPHVFWNKVIESENISVIQVLGWGKVAVVLICSTRVTWILFCFFVVCWVICTYDKITSNKDADTYGQPNGAGKMWINSMVYINIHVLILKLYYGYASCYHWGKLGEWYIDYIFYNFL
jgi:hypothetical protein